MVEQPNSRVSSKGSVGSLATSGLQLHREQTQFVATATTTCESLPELNGNFSRIATTASSGSEDFDKSMVNNASQKYITEMLTRDNMHNASNPPSYGTLPATPGQLYASRASTLNVLPNFSMGSLPSLSMGTLPSLSMGTLPTLSTADTPHQMVPKHSTQARDKEASPACQRWVALAEQVVCNKQESMIMEGKFLLRHEYGRLTTSEEQLSIYIFLNEPSWMVTFPKLAKRISNSMGARLRQHAPPSQDASSSRPVPSEASAEPDATARTTPMSAKGGLLLDGRQLRERKVSEVALWSRSLDVLPETSPVRRAGKHVSCEFLPPPGLRQSDSEEE